MDVMRKAKIDTISIDFMKLPLLNPILFPAKLAVKAKVFFVVS